MLQAYCALGGQRPVGSPAQELTSVINFLSPFNSYVVPFIQHVVLFWGQL